MLSVDYPGVNVNINEEQEREQEILLCDQFKKIKYVTIGLARK